MKFQYREKRKGQSEKRQTLERSMKGNVGEQDWWTSFCGQFFLFRH